MAGVHRHGLQAQAVAEASRWYNDVALGLFPGVYGIHSIGHNHDVSTTIETIWEPGGMYVWPITGGTRMTLSSDNAADNAAGIGATLIKLTYLDANWDQQVELLIPTGLGDVHTVATDILRIVEYEVETAGTFEGCVGDIYLRTFGTAATSGVPDVIADIKALCETGFNISTTAVRSIPKGHVGLVINLNSGVDGNKYVEVELRHRHFGSVFKLAHELHVFQADTSHGIKIPHFLPEKSDVMMAGRSSLTGAKIQGDFELIIMANTHALLDV